MDVFFFEAFDFEAQSLKYYAQKHRFQAGYTAKTIQEYGESNIPASIISIRTQSIIPVSWGEKLQAILTRSTGYEHLENYKNCVQGKFSCGYLPLYCHRAVAEQAMLLWMALLRKLPRQITHFSNFYRDGLTGLECANKTLLVVGVGNIGSQIVKIGKGLDMQVLGVDIAPNQDVSMEDGLSQADIIVCAMNLTKDNHSYFNYDRLKLAKKGAIFVNVSRGELSPTEDLLSLLQEKHLGGVALDVYNNEAEIASLLRQEKIEHKILSALLSLSKLPNVILTPHNAFNTKESVLRKAEHSIAQIINFLETGSFLWPLRKTHGKAN